MIKNVALVFLLLVSMTLGGVLVRVHQHIQTATVRVAELEKQSVVQQNEVRSAKAAVAARDEEQRQAAVTAQAEKQARREAREAAAAATAQAAVTPEPAADPSAPAAKKKGTGMFNGSLAKMMKDPAMKNMMRAAQGTAMKQVYSDFAKQQGFSPEQTDAFYDALLDKQAADMDRGLKLMEKGFDSKAAADPGDSEAKIKAVLGDDAFAQYKDYEKTLMGRYTVSQFQQQLAATNTPAMTTDQTRVLMQAVNDEKVNFPQGIKDDMGKGNMSAMTDPAMLEQFMKAQEDVNGRIDARVEYMLTPDQLKVFKSQQQQAIAMQKVSMEMAAKMMGPSPTP